MNNSILAPRACVQSVPRGALPIPTDGGRSSIDQRLAKAIVKHQNRLNGLLARSKIGSGDAADVVQDAFWILAQRLDGVPERAEASFLTSTVLRLASDRRRSAWNRVMNSQLCIDDWEGSLDGKPDDVVERCQQRSRVDAALAGLPDDERIVFLLIELESMSRQEVATLLGIPAGTVASRAKRARKRFAALVAELALRAPHLSPFLGEGEEMTEMRGRLRFATNAWGRDKTRASFDQRLVQRKRSGVAQSGWSWWWPGFDRSVFSYPAALIGWKPWAGGVPTDARFPILLSKAKELLVDFSVDSKATGSYNLALCAWLCRSGDWTQAPDPSSISTEVMIWPDYSSGAMPPGRFISELQLDGEYYELWRSKGHGKEYKGDDLGWTILTLRGVGGRQTGMLPLGGILSDLSRQGLVEPGLYLTSIELGNEVMGGAGTTFVERFSLQM